MSVENFIPIIMVILLLVDLFVGFLFYILASSRKKADQLEVDRKRFEYMRSIVEDLHANDWCCFNELLNRFKPSTDDKKKG